jgi:hypothetical protein
MTTATTTLDGQTCEYREYALFVAAPLDAELVDGTWYDAQGDELGPEIWEEFYVAERRLHDPCADALDPSL